MKTRRLIAAAILTAATLEAAARADEVVQLPVDELLDGRPVSTLTGGVLVPWTAGLDKDDGFMTAAAAASLHQTGPALPDDGTFAANADHPVVKLHFSNAADATSPQAHLVTAVGSFEVHVPPAAYTKVVLLLTASYGDAPLSIKLTYADRSTTATTFTLPDWGTGKALPSGPPTFFYLVAGLHKWTKAGASVDTPTHAITGVVLVPASDRALTTVEITKTTAAPWLTFWGATGLASGALGGVDAGPDGSPDVVVDGPPGADGEVAPSDAHVEPVDAVEVVDALDAGDASVSEAPTGGGGDAARADAGGAGGAVGTSARDGAADGGHASGGCALGGDSGSAPALVTALAALALGLRRRRRWCSRGDRATIAAP